MVLQFLTPLGALFALAALLPVAVFLGRQRRARRVRANLALEHPRVRASSALVVALAALPVLAGAAAAQPLLDFTRERHERTDAEVFVVLDTSRSMLAAAGPRSQTRFDRAGALTSELRDAIPEVPVGLASLTDRTLPHLFPTTDKAVFDSALAKSLGIEQPGPRFWFSERATDLNALGAVLSRNYFARERRKHVLVVFTDGETRDPPADVVGRFEAAEGVRLVLVPVWAEDERVYDAGVAETAYAADPRGPETLRAFAQKTRAALVEGESAQQLIAAVVAAVGEGPTRVAAKEGQEVPLMPYIALLALAPAAFVLRRRNL